MQWWPARTAMPNRSRTCHVVGMDPRQVERDDAAALVGGRAVQLDLWHLAREVSSA